MNIIPAIDIRNGNCVRLFQGNFAKETIYAKDPVTVAKQWERQGAKLLHVVDLDGAKTGVMQNKETVINIIRSVKIPVQVGGGIRDEKIICELLSSGASGVVIGTIALTNQKFIKTCVKKYANKIIVSLDSKNGVLMQKGWEKKSTKKILSFGKKLKKMGVKRLIYTDISKDGTLTSPNFNEIQNIASNIAIPFIVAGGISSAKDIKQLTKMNIDGAIVGRALYEGRISIC